MKKREHQHRPAEGEDADDAFDNLLAAAFESMPRATGSPLRGEEIRRLAAMSAPAGAGRIRSRSVWSSLGQWIRRPAGSATLGFASGAVVLAATLLTVAPEEVEAPRRMRVALNDPMRLMMVEFDPLNSMLGTFEQSAPRERRDTR